MGATVGPPEVTSERRRQAFYGGGVDPDDEPERDEPEQTPPWRPEDGPRPQVKSWPPGARPALRALIDGQWVYAPVRSCYVGADGRVVYQVDVVMPGELSARHRAYPWPQPDRLRKAHGSPVQPSPCDVPERGPEAPTDPHARRSAPRTTPDSRDGTKAAPASREVQEP